MRQRSNSSAGVVTTAATSKSMSAITINEDDAASFRHSSLSSSGRNSPPNGGGGLGGIRYSKSGKMRRCLSLPETLFDVKSIMRFRTLDESLHSTYGSENGSRNGGSGGEKTNIKMGNVIIREYGRTVGDNPSCSSGPPVS